MKTLSHNISKKKNKRNKSFIVGAVLSCIICLISFFLPWTQPVGLSAFDLLILIFHWGAYADNIYPFIGIGLGLILIIAGAISSFFKGIFKVIIGLLMSINGLYHLFLWNDVMNVFNENYMQNIWGWNLRIDLGVYIFSFASFIFTFIVIKQAFERKNKQSLVNTLNKYCPQCNAPYDASKNFCKKCGQKI